MLVELLNKVLSLATPEYREEEDGRIYSSRTLNEIRPPLVEPIHVQTLTGLADLFMLHSKNAATDDLAAPVIVHVLGHDTVQITAKEADEWRRRAVFVKAAVPTDAPRFRFGQYLEPEDFVVGLQTLFEDGGGFKSKIGDHYKVLKLVSNLAAEAVNISTDDGFSQTVATKQGVAFKNEEKVSPRVELAPFRTFREIDQPKSEFVLRLRTRQNATPLVALFEADGGEWKNTAIASIQEWLKSKLPDADIVA